MRTDFDSKPMFLDSESYPQVARHGRRVASHVSAKVLLQSVQRGMTARYEQLLVLRADARHGAQAARVRRRRGRRRPGVMRHGCRTGAVAARAVAGGAGHAAGPRGISLRCRAGSAQQSVRPPTGNRVQPTCCPAAVGGASAAEKATSCVLCMCHTGTQHGSDVAQQSAAQKSGPQRESFGHERGKWSKGARHAAAARAGGLIKVYSASDFFELQYTGRPTSNSVTIAPCCWREQKGIMQVALGSLVMSGHIASLPCAKSRPRGAGLQTLICVRSAQRASIYRLLQP